MGCGIDLDRDTVPETTRSHAKDPNTEEHANNETVRTAYGLGRVRRIEHSIVER